MIKRNLKATLSVSKESKEVFKICLWRQTGHFLGDRSKESKS
jgi:hypothetical protein